MWAGGFGFGFDPRRAAWLASGICSHLEEQYNIEAQYRRQKENLTPVESREREYTGHLSVYTQYFI